MRKYKASTAVHFVTGIMFALVTAIDHVLRSVKPRESNVQHPSTSVARTHDSTYANTAQQAHRRRRDDQTLIGSDEITLGSITGTVVVQWFVDA
jgi:hypothetical protein